MQNYENLIRMQNYYLKIFLLTTLFLSQITDNKAQNHIAKKADSLFNAKKYLEAAKLYEAIFEDEGINKPNLCLKMAFINENLSNYPKAIFYLNNYYNQSPTDEIFEKMNKMALENKFSGFERSDLNFILMLYQQYYIYILYLFIAIGVFLIFILARKKASQVNIQKRHLIILFIFIIFLASIINVPNTFKAAIVNKKSYLRVFPSSAAPIKGIITEGNKVNIFGKESNWLKIYWRKKVYFIHQNDTWLLDN
jgi:tetratricopeptide (TPR) repeat protein